MHNAVVEEFGDSPLRRPLGTEESGAAENQQEPQIATGMGMEQHEYAWASGYVEDVETGDRIASGARWHSSSDQG